MSRKARQKNLENLDNLCETKVLASGRDGGENLSAQGLVALVFGEVKFCSSLAFYPFKYMGGVYWNLRLKQVCELGSLSLFP